MWSEFTNSSEVGLLLVSIFILKRVLEINSVLIGDFFENTQ